MTTSTPQRVLVVDDDPGLRDLLATYLGANGFVVSSANDGNAMWAALESGMPDEIGRAHV